MPSARSLSIYADEDYAHTIELWADEELTQPLDTSLWTYSAQVKKRKGSGEVLAQFVVDTSVPGEITLRLDRAVVLTLAEKIIHGWWDLQTIRVSDGYVDTWFAGEVRVGMDVTR